MAKILVIRLAAIADVAMTLPVIYSAAKANPQDSFTVLTQAFMIPVFINRPPNLEVIGIKHQKAGRSFAVYLCFGEIRLRHCPGFAGCDPDLDHLCRFSDERKAGLHPG